jgi:hypothetical protein
MRAPATAVGLALILTASAAAAQTSLDPFTRCAAIPTDAERLACYDAAVSALSAEQARIVAERQRLAAEAKAKAEAQARAKAEADAKAQAEADAKARVAAFGAESMPAAARAQDTGELETLRVKVAEALMNPLGYVTLILDNGQIWRQSEAASLPPIRPGDIVEIKRGMIGGFRLTFERQKRTIRVTRFR